MKDDKLKKSENEWHKKDTLAWRCIITWILFIALNSAWMWLEVLLYGEIQNRRVDNIISVPILVSFWFNSGSIMGWILRKSKKLEEEK